MNETPWSSVAGLTLPESFGQRERYAFVHA